MAMMFLVRGSIGYALPVSAGVTLYVAATDLVPESNREPGAAMGALVFLGVAVMVGLKYAFHF
jgi:ZIP family zinc transporter/zinc and cadmium transporter